ncbi:alpha/beta hydrolase [Celeribacter sp.]|uniref:alpha/beta hydrolase n=1 Tax=Celeribacter sp. TaxID=1890673 RepID=UPI003A8DD6D4
MNSDILNRRTFLLGTAALTLAPSLAAARANTLRDLPYGSHRLNTVDVYLPETSQNAPLAIMVHGGAWKTGDKSNGAVWRNKRRMFNDMGYIFVSVNYRMLPAVQPLEQAMDVARAMAFIQANAASWGGDAGRSVVLGHSAGAHLVTLLAADPELARSGGAAPWQATVALDSAVYDVEEVMEGSPARLYRQAFGDDPDYWRACSPMARLTQGRGPFLLVCSTERSTSCTEARDFAAAVSGQGGEATVLPVALGHREINTDLGAQNAYTAAVLEFINAQGLS